MQINTLISFLIVLLLSACSEQEAGSPGEQVSEDAVAFYKTPRELVQEMSRLQSRSCHLKCQMAIAGMYSTAFLESQRQAVMLGLVDKTHRKNNLMLFFGEEIPLHELESMSSQEFFARQLWYRERTTPPDLIMSKLDIVSEEQLSEHEVQMVVVRSGVVADPEYKEEDVMTFVLEGDAWRIKH